ncbi:cell surface protein SprA [Carboxylicivirga sp. N1Y90]|uniref:T9SS outer membrane translocon Sov/SprA n=1 Tax=Carboxylicivirga fragile TaxID=3417571 RepID=UPI003D346C21|nr:cell surface protein SprA [Marinilabiliaceae bacterium N1Y90]
MTQLTSTLFTFIIALCLCSCQSDNTEPIEPEDLSYQLANPTIWSLASTPDRFTESTLVNDLGYAYNRAKLAWYVINPEVFYRNTTLMPDHIKNDEDQRNHSLVREIFKQEIYPDRQAAYGKAEAINSLNLAYYPVERGPYNYDTDNINTDGSLKNPQLRWAGMMTSIEIKETQDTIAFWLMDPFTSNESGYTGKLYLNFGTISEDVLSDGYNSCEQGLMLNDEILETAWGLIPSNASYPNHFDSDKDIQLQQDIGLDGFRSDTLRKVNSEATYFSDFLSVLKTKLSEPAYDKISKDPSSDDFHFYRGLDYDQMQRSILDRYKYFNNPERNSLDIKFSHESYSVAATTKPDYEDIDLDNAINTTSDYKEFVISIDRDNMQPDQQYIDDMRISWSPNNIKTRWYHFSIPIDNLNDELVGTNQTLRIYLSEFNKPIVLRLVDFKLQ